MAGGRPTKYNPDMCEQVKACGDAGMTIIEMCRDIGITRETMRVWRETNPEFSAAVNEGLDRAQAWWEMQGRIATFGGCDGYNATSYIFQMKNRFKEDWRDRQDHTLANPDGTPIQFQTVIERKPE